MPWSMSVERLLQGGVVAGILLGDLQRHEREVERVVDLVQQPGRQFAQRVHLLALHELDLGLLQLSERGGELAVVDVQFVAKAEVLEPPDRRFVMSSTSLQLHLLLRHYASIRRFEDFRLRHELDVNNQELASTLQKLKETEVQLVQTEKMNALGKLSAGLLHEINNPLNFTFMALQMAEQEAEDNASLKETLKDIGQGMTRIRGVISDLRAFAYPSQAAAIAEPFSIEEALTTAMRLTAHELGDIPVERDGVDRRARPLGAKTQIVHVFMNLLVNSAQAMQDQAAGPQAADHRVTCERRRTGTAGGRRCGTTASGVKAADLPRLFEPFFTTKDVGEGIGPGPEHLPHDRQEPRRHDRRSPARKGSGRRSPSICRCRSATSARRQPQ